MEALVGRDRSQTAPQMLTAPGERRIVGGGEVEAHHPRTVRAGTLRLGAAGDGRGVAGQGGLDGEIRVAPLPTPRPLRRGVQAAIASEDNHTVTSPRRTRA